MDLITRDGSRCVLITFFGWLNVQDPHLDKPVIGNAYCAVVLQAIVTLKGEVEILVIGSKNADAIVEFLTDGLHHQDNLKNTFLLTIQLVLVVRICIKNCGNDKVEITPTAHEGVLVSALLVEEVPQEVDSENIAIVWSMRVNEPLKRLEIIGIRILYEVEHAPLV